MCKLSAINECKHLPDLSGYDPMNVIMLTLSLFVDSTLTNKISAIMRMTNYVIFCMSYFYWSQSGSKDPSTK